MANPNEDLSRGFTAKENLGFHPGAPAAGAGRSSTHVRPPQPAPGARHAAGVLVRAANPARER